MEPDEVSLVLDNFVKKARTSPKIKIQSFKECEYEYEYYSNFI